MAPSQAEVVAGAGPEQAAKGYFLSGPLLAFSSLFLSIFLFDLFQIF